MSQSGDRRPIVLDGLPPVTFRAAVVFLDDALRECQLVLVAQSQGHATAPELSDIAARLVPSIEEIADAFRAAEVTTADDGSVRLAGSLGARQLATVAEVQRQLIELRFRGRQGALLLDADPRVSALLAWIWNEVADQLTGRAPRPYRHAD